MTSHGSHAVDLDEPLGTVGAVSADDLLADAGRHYGIGVRWKRFEHATRVSATSSNPTHDRQAE